MTSEIIVAKSAEEISEEIMRLPQDQLQKFREWYEVFDSEKWDDQIACDASGGKLDEIADRAMKEYKAGKSRPI